MGIPKNLSQEQLKLAEYRVRCIEAIFSGGSISQRENIEQTAQRLYDFVVKDLSDEKEAPKI